MAISLNSTRMLLRFKSFRVSSAIANRYFCSSKTPDENGKNQDAGEPKQNEQLKAKEKLKMLLDSMDTLSSPSTATEKLELTRPVSRRTPKQNTSVKTKTKLEKNIIEAVDKVANTLPQDKEEIKSDLMEKLHSLNEETEIAKIKAEKPSKEEVNILHQMVGSMASESTIKEQRRTDRSRQTKMKVAQVTTEEGTESSVKKQSLETSRQVKEKNVARITPLQKFTQSKELNMMLGSMKVEEKAKSMGWSLLSKDLPMDKMPLGLFKNAQFTPESSTVKLFTWNMLEERELRLVSSQVPNNGFEQMIRWTEQGKLWKFPINNEQGMEEEAKVGFHEHIFMEQHLEPWCPPRGPIRHFMELVCVGLSKNPYLTVSQKKDHINWFRNYFDAKRDILIETGALGELGKSSNAPPA